MSDLIKKIQDEAGKVLKSKRVDIVIAFGKGSLPFRVKPVFIDNEKDVDIIIWNSFCNLNLARYLTRYPGKKVGIVAKGCDTRSIVTLIQERKVERKNVYIIGVPCEGMVGISDVRKRCDLNNVEEIREEMDKIFIKEHGKEKEFTHKEIMSISCDGCRFPGPVIYDVITGKEKKASGDRFANAKKFEELSIKERAEYFKKEFAKCIRCYACREACPVCYCKTCFTDSSSPKWIDRGVEQTDKAMYLVIRAFHMIGRCSDCGACTRVCPEGVDLNLIMNKIASDLKDNYKFESGRSIEEKEPLLTFSEDDPDDFVL